MSMPDLELAFGWAFAWFLVVESAFCFLVLCLLLIFHLYSNTYPAKHDFSNTSGTRSIVKAYMSKDCLFLLFGLYLAVGFDR
jgi:hypothetical protein